MVSETIGTVAHIKFCCTYIILSHAIFILTAVQSHADDSTVVQGHL